MARALALAERGLYTTTPNPRVGCVIVRAGEIVGEGYHERAGQAHAEVNALAQAGTRAAGATAYVTLEPCNHHGRTPPCVDALIAAKVARVIAAMPDPNPVASGGAERLRDAGIAYHVGLMAEAAQELNIGFVSRVTRGRPWVRLKVAASLDGRTALANGISQWITGPDARRDGHHYRARACAVLTGIGTVRDDDPQLTVRDIATPRQPLRVLVDSRLEVPRDARIFKGVNGAPGGNVIVAGAVEHRERIAMLESLGAEVIILPNPHGKVELADLLAVLGRRGINELHIEAGHKLNGSLVREEVIDELLVYLAPTLIGDSGQGMFNLPVIDVLAKAVPLRIHSVDRIGQDLRVVARLMRTTGAARNE